MGKHYSYNQRKAHPREGVNGCLVVYAMGLGSMGGHASLFRDVNEVAHLGGDGGVGRSAEGVGFRVSEHVGQPEEVAAFDEEVADTGFQLHAYPPSNAIFKRFLYGFAVLFGQVVGAVTFVPRILV